jgi:glutaredoxin-like protein NrdH
MIELWSKPNCIQCDATKIALEQRGKVKGIDFQEFSLVEDREALDRFKAAGYMSAPIVVTEHMTWAGFRPELIEKL